MIKLPLHLACECSASDGVVKALLRDWPTGAQTLESLYGYVSLFSPKTGKFQATSRYFAN